MHIIAPFEDGYSLPPDLQSVLRGNPRENRHARFDAAFAFARNGFPVARLEMNGKRPIEGWHQASTDVEKARDRWIDFPDSNVGVRGEESRVYVDIDERHGGTLESAEACGIETRGFRYRTPDGWRIPMVMPAGISAKRSPHIAPGIEIKGPTLGVVVPHSSVDGNWYGIESGREIWGWAQLPDSWIHLPKITNAPATHATLKVFPQDREAADRIVDRLVEGIYQERVSLILSGEWKQAGYRSRSEADAGLCYMASHHLRGCPRRAEILTALIEKHSQKVQDHPSPRHYIDNTVDFALKQRQCTDEQHVSELRAIITHSHQHAPTRSESIAQASQEEDLYDANFSQWYAKRQKKVIALLSFAGTEVIDQYSETNGWRRLPVNHFGAMFDVGREAVRQIQIAAQDAGWIERASKRRNHEGRIRRDAWVRITDRGGEVLNIFRCNPDRMNDILSPS